MATQQEQPSIRLAPSAGARARRFFDAFLIITRSNPNVLIGVVILTAILLMTVFLPNHRALGLHADHDRSEAATIVGALVRHRRIRTGCVR